MPPRLGILLLNPYLCWQVWFLFAALLERQYRVEIQKLLRFPCGHAFMRLDLPGIGIGVCRQFG
jgi:hypothetical protein